MFEVDCLADLVESTELLPEPVDALVIADREHLGRQSVSRHGCAADARGERVPRPLVQQVRGAASHSSDHASVCASEPQGRPTDLGHLHLDGCPAGGHGHAGADPIDTGRRVDSHFGRQHRCAARWHIGTECEPVPEGSGADRLDAHRERAVLDALPGEGDAIGQPRRRGVRCPGDVQDHEPLTHLSDRGRRQPEAVDLEAFEVPGRRPISQRIHPSAPFSWAWPGRPLRAECPRVVGEAMLGAGPRSSVIEVPSRRGHAVATRDVGGIGEDALEGASGGSEECCIDAE